MLTIDARGLRCPQPIVETRKALKNSSSGETFVILIVNKNSFNNVSRFLNDQKIKFSVSEDSGIWRLVVNVKNNDANVSDDYYCDLPGRGIKLGDFAIAVPSENMGSGDDDLGQRLMESFFSSISCLDELPSCIVFYNSGVKLLSGSSEVTEILKEMESKGVEVLVCGTCVDHFRLDGKIKAGIITDMFTITRKLAAAGNVIRP